MPHSGIAYMRAFALTIPPLRCKIVLRHQLPDATNFFLPDERSYTGPHKHSQSARSLRVNTMLGAQGGVQGGPKAVLGRIFRSKRKLCSILAARWTGRSRFQ